MFISTVGHVKHKHRQSGISLIELVMFIMIVSVGIVGILSVMNVTSQHSADPQLRKQALAVAEALLEEVQMMPFTDCDPEGYDPDAVCPTPGSVVEGMGLEFAYAAQSQDETRGSLIAPFDNVNDYNDFTLAGGEGDIGSSGAVIVPTGYDAEVRVTEDGGLGPAGGLIAAADALRIEVTVKYNNNNDSIVLEGYRTRYAPNAMP
jgi:MSHA pilin protein MshD